MIMNGIQLTETTWMNLKNIMWRRQKANHRIKEVKGKPNNILFRKIFIMGIKKVKEYYHKTQASSYL